MLEGSTPASIPRDIHRDSNNPRNLIIRKRFINTKETILDRPCSHYFYKRDLMTENVGMQLNGVRQ